MSASTHYAECLTDGCGQTFANRDEMRAHGTETLDAAIAAIAANPEWTKTGSVSGHSCTVVNPAPEEARANKVRSRVGWAIESAIDEFIRSIERDVDRDEITANEVRDELRGYPDFADSWDEYMAEVDS